MGELPPDLQQCMRFSPSKEKAISILLSKITGNCNGLDFIFEAQKSNLEPWDLKELCSAWLDLCGIKMGGYPESWFFSLPNRNRKGSRARATYSGFWKVTAEKEEITLDSGLIGERNILVFYEGRGKGKKTNWKIHEYSIPGQNAFVLCRLSYKHEKSFRDPYINDARPDVSSSSASKNFLEEISESELSLASVLFPASDVHPITAREKCDETLYATATSVKCDDKHLSAHSAETQLGELTTTNDDSQVEDMIIELQQKVACNVLMPSTSLPNNSTVSSATTAKSSIEELEFMQGLDMVCPEKYFGRKTMNDIGLNSSNQNSSNACAARNEVPEATASKVDLQFEDGINLFDLLSEPPDCNLSSDQNSYNAYVAKNEVPETSATEVDLLFEEGLSMSDLLLEPPYCDLPSLLPLGMPLGMSSPITNENFPNTFGNQKNLPLVSIKDNGSCGGLDAKLANKPFESTFLNSGEISEREATSGLLNLESHMVWMGGSPNQILIRSKDLIIFRRIIDILRKMSLSYRLNPKIP